MVRHYAARVMQGVHSIDDQLQGMLGMDEAVLAHMGWQQQQHMVRRKDSVPKVHCMVIAVGQPWETVHHTARLIQL